MNQKLKILSIWLYNNKFIKESFDVMAVAQQDGDNVIRVIAPNLVKPLSDEAVSCDSVQQRVTITDMFETDEEYEAARQKIIKDIVCPAIALVNNYLEKEWWNHAWSYHAHAIALDTESGGISGCKDEQQIMNDINYLKDCDFDFTDEIIEDMQEIIKKKYEKGVDKFNNKLNFHIALNEDDPNRAQSERWDSPPGGTWRPRDDTIRINHFIPTTAWLQPIDDWLHNRTEESLSTSIHEIAHSFYTYFSYGTYVLNSKPETSNETASERLYTARREDTDVFESIPLTPKERAKGKKRRIDRTGTIDTRMEELLRKLIDPKMLNDYEAYLDRARDIDRLAKSNFSWPAQTLLDVPLSYWLEDSWPNVANSYYTDWQKDRSYISNPTEIYARIWVMRLEGLSLLELCSMSAGDIDGRLMGSAYDVQKLRMFMNCSDKNLLQRIDSQVAILQEQSESPLEEQSMFA